MSIRSSERGSSGETEAERLREGITQQPGPFYNGNFSSSIWGNPPTPPLWRDMPPPNASCSTSGAQSFGFSSSSEHTAEPVYSHKIDILNRKEEKVSRWAGDFPFRQQAGAQESVSSPFSYGFPPPSPSPQSLSSSCAHVTSNGSSYLQTHLAGKNIDGNSHKNPVIGKSSMLDKESSQDLNEENAFSLKDLSNKWESMLQSQDGPWCSTESQAPLRGSSMFDSAAGLASFKDIRQPLEHSYGNPFVNADISFRKERPAQHSYGNPFANADMPSNCLDKQPLKHSYDNPFANVGTNTASLHAQQPSFIGCLSAFPNLENCKRTPAFCRQKGDSGTFVFGSYPVYDNSANVGLSQQKGFVFGSGAASGVSANVGFSQQRDSYSSAAGSMPRLSITNTKDKKHNFFVNKKKSTPPARTAFQPGPFKPISDMSCHGNSFFKFTIGASDADRSHCPVLADSGCGPASNLQNLCASAQKDSSSFGVNTTGSPTPSIFAGAASTSTEETHSMDSSLEGDLFQQRSKNQSARSIGEKFTTWHPFLQKEEKSVKKCGSNRDLNEVSSSESTSSWSTSDKHENWEASGARGGFSHEELPKPPLETNRTLEGSKLAEFDLNSPGNPSVEDLREKAAKWVRSGEEIKRQKENQEPKFVFGSQKASRPFVFSASRTPGSTKHATLSADALNKKERHSKGSKESKVLEHLLNKLGEKMANLGKCDATQNNHSAYRGETVVEGIREFNDSSKGSCKELAKDSLGAADVFAKNIALNCSIEELREQLAKLGRSDNQVNGQNDKAGQVGSSFHGNNIALENAVKELGEQIAKLVNFGEEQEEDTANKGTPSSSEAPHTGFCDSSALKHAVEELSEQIAKLGRAVRGNNKDDSSSIKGHHNDINEQSGKNLCKKMATLGIVAKENNYNSNHESIPRPNMNKVDGAFLFPACNAGAPEESVNIPFSWSKKAYAKYCGGAGSIKNAYINPFRDVPQSTLFPRNAFTGAESSNSFSQVNPFAAGQAPPFTQSHSGAKSSLHEMSASSNGVGEGWSQKGFEFHGIKGPPSGTTMHKKIGRACVNMRRCDKENMTRQKKSPALQTKVHSSPSVHNTGSPMDVSPCTDMHASVSPKSGLDQAQQAPGWKSRGPNFGEDESMSVEELRRATSNLSFGKEDESRMGDHQNSRSFEHSLDKASPFVLHQKKGTWRRASRNKSSTNWTDSKVQFTSTPKTAGACGIDRRVPEEHTQNSSGEGFNLRSFSPLTDTHIQDARDDSVRKSTRNQGSSVFSNGKVVNVTSMFSSTKLNPSFRFKKLVKEQKDSSKCEEPPASSTGTRTATAEQVCENWRLRGNQAYAKGDYEKAEDCYTHGVGGISSENTSQSYRRASMLCYSNRAATRMAVGRMREALEDCKQATMLDSSFLRVRLRAASCHLALGENNAAAALFVECWNHAKEKSSSDMKIVEEALEGIRKSQRFGDLLERASKLCQGEISKDSSAALNLLDEALLICPFSEALLELRAHTLFSVRRFEDVLHLCQQTLPAAEENMVAEQHHNQFMAKDKVLLNLWRWRTCGKSFFHLGRLEESLSVLTKYEEATCTIPPNRAANLESMAALVSTIRDLLQHKASGNEAFQAGRHDEAIEHYTAALACNGESRPYNAVCFCNRAAASQALDHIADAIADCSRAIVLDPQYAKAISRRATLHEMLRDYGQTCNDLERLVTLLEGQEARSKSPKLTRAGSKIAQDLRQARDRFEKATKEMKKGSAVDHYRILGLDVSCSSNDVKKAYRKAALKHHPDKAGQVLARGENGDDGNLWKEVGDEARRDAERLFKLIGEANATLSDPEKRAQYDAENYMPRARNPTHTRDGSTDDNWSHGEKSGRRQRDRREWHSARYYRWQNGPDAAEPDTYSERGSRDSSASKDSKNKGRHSDFYW